MQKVYDLDRFALITPIMKYPSSRNGFCRMAIAGNLLLFVDFISIARKRFSYFTHHDSVTFFPVLLKIQFS